MPTESAPTSREAMLFTGSTVLLGLLTLGHALIFWNLRATVALFGGGAVIAFIGEAIVINRNWLRHHLGRQVLGVPLYVLFEWTGVVYIAFRLALIASDGWLAVLIAAILATAYDVTVDHRGVERGYWTYTANVPGPSVRDVPLWNFAGWLLISFLTASLTLFAWQ